MMERILGRATGMAQTDRWGETAMLEAFIDAPQVHEGLAVFPIIAPQGPMLPFLLSTEIDGSGALTVRERAEEKVPMLLARNNSLHPLLILAGEPLPGGSPGRLIERSILLAGKHVTQIPASSMESGGWVSPDGEAEITSWLRSFPVQKQQVGFLAFHEDRLLGLEAMGSVNLYNPLHRRLLIRFMKRALHSPQRTSTPPVPPFQAGGNRKDLESEAQRVVDAIEDAGRVDSKRVGLGNYYSLAGPISGGELIYEGHLVHLSVRPTTEGATIRPNEGGAD